MRIALVAVAVFLNACAPAIKNAPATPINPAPEIEKAVETYKEFLSRIGERYYQKVDHSVLTQWAIESALLRLNSHGQLLREATETTCNKTSGLGIELGRTYQGRVVVTRVAFPSKAFVDGVQIGDIVLDVDETPIIDQSQNEVARLIICNNKPQITLRLLRGNAVMEKTIEKGKNEFTDYIATSLTGGIAYFYFSSVGDSLWPKYIELMVRRLKRNPSLDAILDLRSMRGGYTIAAKVMVSAFLPAQTDLYFVGNGTTIQSDSRERPLANRLVVLTNRATRSAGELIALAFKNTGRAIIIGEKTTGFGTFISGYTLPDDSFLSIPFTEYYGLWGEIVESHGVAPNIEVEESNPVAHFVPGMRDAILERAIEYLRNKPAQYAKAPQ